MNTFDIAIRQLDISKNIGMKICFVSDVHIGSIHSEKLLNKLEHMVSTQEPDLIIMGGDMFESNAFNKYKDLTIKTLSSLKAKYGKIAIIGNHEIYSGLEKSKELFELCGIKLLIDQYVTIDDKVCILGRTDMLDKNRKTLSEIFPKTDKPVILVDHTPTKATIEETLSFNIKLCLSAHTHGGQIFPQNIRELLFYKYRSGVLYNLKEMFAYITKGFGVSGFPGRLFAQAELVVINL